MKTKLTKVDGVERHQRSEYFNVFTYVIGHESRLARVQCGRRANGKKHTLKINLKATRSETRVHGGVHGNIFSSFLRLFTKLGPPPP